VLCPAAPSIGEFLAKHSIPVVPHLPHLPDLALCNFLPQAEDHPEGEEISAHSIVKTITWQVQAIPE